ncbi:Sapep family Mn(2+)-dependent dipeptidase [uncultured Robinsoniella sp.]|uniref:Sapep family Mn(2+)-dependent dipeptidase n=1 Tax=uncultured Robinsoniella sp. TaxID=904190 RepID=UPI00374FC254
MTEEQKIWNWIEDHENELIEDITCLVEVPSISSQAKGDIPYGENCQEVIDRFLRMADGYDFRYENHEYYCCSILFGSGETELGIWGHLDVVPEGRDWIYPPYTCIRKGDFLIGRGVQDNKGPSVAVLYALRCIRDILGEPAIRYRQILGCQEEAGMQDVSYYLEHHPAPDYSIVADCAFPVCCGEKGICNIRLTSPEISGSMIKIEGGNAENMIPDQASAVFGQILQNNRHTVSAMGISGHSAFPEGTQNAIGILCGDILKSGLAEGTDRKIIEFLECVCRDGYGIGCGIACEDGLSGKLTSSGTIVQTKENRVELHMNIRYPITMNREGILKRLQVSADKYGFQAELLNDSRPNYVDRESPWIQDLCKIYRAVTGDSGMPYVMGGGTYARNIPNAVGFGPGLPVDFGKLGLPPGHGNCHCADEAQSISNLKKAIAIYTSALWQFNIKNYKLNLKK